MANTKGPMVRMELYLQSERVEFVVDTGATHTFISDSLGRRYGACRHPQQSLRIAIGDGSTIDVDHSVDLPFECRSLGLKASFRFFVFPGLPAQGVLGLNFLRKYNLSVAPKLNRVLPTPEVLLLAQTQDNVGTDVNYGKLADELSKSQRGELEGLLKAFADCFSTEGVPIGRATGHEFTIDTGSQAPLKRGLRPTSPMERATIQEQLDTMLKMGVVRPSTSPWASGVTLAPKADGSVRFCVNYQRLNDVTVKDVYPLPRISDMLEALAGAKFFCSLDAASGYWQIPMAEADIAKTAFICPQGLFEFTVMPFGLTNAPAFFQRFMANLLAGLVWTELLVYLDDVLIFADTFEELQRRVRRALERIRASGIRLKGKKCTWAARELKFVGHIVSADGVGMDPSKIKAIQEYPRPVDTAGNVSKTDLLSFLGMAGYYRRFVRNFSVIAGPLYEATRLDAPGPWSADAQEAFDAIRAAILKDAVLAHPQFNLPFLVDTDASDYGLGAVVSQVIDGVERPLGFASRRLTPAERKWPIREKEALGILFGLESFRHFLLGSKFTVRTDHSSLNLLKGAEKGRLGRWALRLAEFGDWDVLYRPGKAHGNCDALSRAFAPSECLPEHATAFMLKEEPAWWTLEELKEEQSRDKECQRMLSQLEGQKRSDLCFQDGILCTRTGTKLRLVLPERFRERAIEGCHDLNHSGARRTKALLRDRYFWPGLSDDVNAYVDACLECKQWKAPKPRQGLLASKPPTERWATVAADFFGPLPTSTRGNRFVMVIVDHFTKWVTLAACEDQLAGTVCRVFAEKIVAEHGCPQVFLSDNGPQFTSRLVKTLCAAFGIRKAFSSAYYPQGDGQAERFMRTMKGAMAILSRSDPLQWDDYLPAIQLAYNASQHAATGCSPFYLNTGRVPRLPNEGERVICDETGSFPERVKDVIEDACAKARLHVHRAWSRLKARYDIGRKDIRLREGDWVCVRLSDYERSLFPSLKLAPYWSAPLRIGKPLKNGVTYQVIGNGEIKSVHVSRLLPLNAIIEGEEPQEVDNDTDTDECEVVIDNDGWVPYADPPASGIERSAPRESIDVFIDDEPDSPEFRTPRFVRP